MFPRTDKLWLLGQMQMQPNPRPGTSYLAPANVDYPGIAPSPHPFVDVHRPRAHLIMDGGRYAKRARQACEPCRYSRLTLEPCEMAGFFWLTPGS